MRKITLKVLIKYNCHKERQAKKDCHRYGLPYGAHPIKRRMQYMDKYHWLCCTKMWIYRR